VRDGTSNNSHRLTFVSALYSTSVAKPEGADRPRAIGKNELVAGVEGGAEQKNGGDASDHLSEVCGLFGVEGTTKKRELAVS
jgi:hypothetical protein